MDGVRASRAEKKMVFSPGNFGNRPVRVSSSGEFIQVNGKSYRGSIELRNKNSGLLLVINELDIEDYLLGVVAAEIPHDWGPEALKAQAVASRTFALYQKKTAGKKPYHILATVNGQMYIGRRGERPSAVRAVRETEGFALEYNGEVIQAFYHSSCGGHTEDAFELWGIDAPYLKGVDCDCQRISKYGVWEKRFAPSSLATALHRSGYRVGAINAVTIGSITPAGRVRSVSVRDAAGITIIPAEDLRRAVGYSQVPSVFFETEILEGEVVFSGRGLGHGVGLCQWGAKEMADRGLDYRAILSHYYPGTRIVDRRRVGQ